MKHVRNCGHFWPVQSSRRASILAHAVLDSGRILISARSPDSVVFSHSRMIWKSATSSRPARIGFLLRVVDLLPAGVVVPALHVADAQGRGEVPLQERNVLEEELLLQVLGAGGDHHARAERMAGTR